MEAIWTFSAIIWAYYLKFSVTNCDNPKGLSIPYFRNKVFFGKKKRSLHPNRNVLGPEIQSASKHCWFGGREVDAEVVTPQCHRDRGYSSLGRAKGLLLLCRVISSERDHFQMEKGYPKHHCDQRT